MTAPRGSTSRSTASPARPASAISRARSRACRAFRARGPTTPAAAFAGQPFFRSALRALRGGGVNMDVPISLGILLALTMSVVETVNHAAHAYFDSAITLMFFLLIGRYCDLAMRRKTRSVAANL